MCAVEKRAEFEHSHYLLVHCVESIGVSELPSRNEYFKIEKNEKDEVLKKQIYVRPTLMNKYSVSDFKNGQYLKLDSNGHVTYYRLIEGKIQAAVFSHNDYDEEIPQKSFVD